jgi:hypothetical protein
VRDVFPEFSEYPQFQPNYYSYPSGHITILAFLTVINQNLRDANYLKPLSYVLIAALGISLVLICIGTAICHLEQQ